MNVGKVMAEVVVIALLSATGVAAAGNAPDSGLAAPSLTGTVTLTIVSATANPTTLDNSIVAKLQVTGSTNDDGSGNDFVCAFVFDDLVLKVSQCLTVPVGVTSTLTFTLNWNGPIGTAFQGVGLVFYDTTSGGTPQDTSGVLLGGIDPLDLATAVPTLSEWALIAMVALLVVGGVLALRRRPALM